jgi:putative MATE family efflux protein
MLFKKNFMSRYQHTIDGFRSALSLIRKSLSGDEQDYTSGSIRRAVFLLAIPMILEMCMESVFAIVDIFFVGKLGKSAVAAVGLTESVLTLLYSVAIGLSMAATAVVARRIGEKKQEEAARSAGQAILIGLVIDLGLSLAGVFLAPLILGAMGAPASVVKSGAIYTRIMFGGSAAIMFLYLINGIFRGAGNASIAMWSLWIGNGFNILLCPLLIHYFGLQGAAIATTVGRGSGVLYQLFHLFRGKGLIRLRLAHFTPDWPIIRSLSRIAWTGTLQFLIGSASWIVMARIISSFGSEAIAGYQVSIRVILFFLLPAWGLSNAAATLVGQNLGAKQPQRAEKSVWTTAGYNVIFMVLVSLLFIFASRPIIEFLNSDPSVQRIAIQSLHTVSLGYVFYGVGMVLTNAFNGAGDTRTPTIINLFCFWAFQIPMAYLLAISLHFGPKGVFLSIVTAETLITLTALVIFRKGNWKRMMI